MFRPLLGSLLLLSLATSSAQQPASVESKGQHPEIKLEQLISGHLTELNGRYKLRVTEVTFDPNGYIGPHHHVGPGIRCVTSGELTYVQPDKTSIYRNGDCFYESGDVSHTAHNATAKSVVLLNFEIVPAAHAKGTAVPVPK
jgi:quercetin dioxygenase-like cupin family protein